eukprot:11322401-Alexandrium_andersonii.AAC.1
MSARTSKPNCVSVCVPEPENCADIPSPSVQVAPPPPLSGGVAAANSIRNSPAARAGVLFPGVRAS